MAMLSRFALGNCTGSRVIEPINSTTEEQQDKLVAKVKEAPVSEAQAVPSAPTPDHAVEAEAPSAVLGAAPAVPAGTAAETTAGATMKPPESGAKVGV